jgi:hypothetical protein
MGKRSFDRMARYAIAAALAGLSVMTAACATVHVKVDPINIYAKLDADVRVRLDREVQSVIQQNPNLF